MISFCWASVLRQWDMMPFICWIRLLMTCHGIVIVSGALDYSEFAFLEVVCLIPGVTIFTVISYCACPSRLKLKVALYFSFQYHIVEGGWVTSKDQLSLEDKSYAAGEMLQPERGKSGILIKKNAVSAVDELCFCSYTKFTRCATSSDGRATDS